MKKRTKVFISFSLTLNILMLLVFGEIIYKKGTGWIAQKTTFVFNSKVTDDKTTPDYLNYLNKRDSMNNLPISTDDIIFLGDSITEGCQWDELFQNSKIINRGIGNDTTERTLNRIDGVTKQIPNKVFILLGINDLQTSVKESVTLSNYNKIISDVLTKSPKTKIYIQSILPINSNLGSFGKVTNNDVVNLNVKLKSLENNKNIFYVNLYDSFISNGVLNKSYTFDGIHLNSKGYTEWKSIIKDLVI